MDRDPSAPDALPARVHERPTWLIGRLAVRSHRLLADALAAQGARGYDYRLLAALAEAGPASQADLGRRTHIDRSDVVASLNDLAAAGSIRRAPDPDDRRRNVVSITPAGSRRLQVLDAVLVEVQDELLAPLSASDRARFVRLLGRLVEPDAEP